MNNKRQLLFDVDWLNEREVLNDANKEFDDFGEFKYKNKKLMGVKSLLIHFETKEDFEQFKKVTGMPVSYKANFVWYPYKKRKKYPDLNKEDLINE